MSFIQGHIDPHLVYRAKLALQKQYPDIFDKGREVYPENCRYYAWTETFGNTAGPWGGMGGSRVTTFQIEAIVVPPSYAVVYCSGRFWKFARFNGYTINLEDVEDITPDIQK